MEDSVTNTIIDNMATTTLLLDESLTIHYANPAVEQLFALSCQRLLNKNLSQLIQYSSLDLTLLIQPLQTGQSISDSDVTLVIEGKPCLVEMTASPLSHNNSLMILVELKQVDQQRRLSQELNQHAQQQAAKVLVRSLAHEIKNPLGGLRGAAQLLERMLPNPALHEYTQIIIEQADRLRGLVDRLLGPQKLGEKQEANLHQLLERVRQLIELESSSSLTIVRDYDPSLPDIYINSDQVEQALLNIVSNAAQILETQEQGYIQLKTRTAHQVSIHGKHHRLVAMIEITDNGPGIPQYLQDILFYPMVSGREGGTGLGLSIAQTLIDQNNGKIDVKSWPGQTCFTIYIPFNDKEANDE